jgi:hypothetical protein
MRWNEAAVGRLEPDCRAVRDPVQTINESEHKKGVVRVLPPAQPLVRTMKQSS